MHQWKRSAAHHWNIRAAQDFEQSKSVGHFLVAPLVPADHGYTEDLYLFRLNQQRHGLHVGAAGSSTIFVDNDLAARLAPGQGTGQQQRKREPRHSSSLAQGQKASFRAN